MSDDKIVWGEGPFSARTMILGMCPGPEELREGRPFVGGSGRVLDRACQRVGLPRSNCYVTNLVKHFVPPGQPLPRKLIEQDHPLLDKEFEMLTNLSVIITLGKEAFDGITGLDFKTRHNRKAAEKSRTYWLRGCPYEWNRAGRVFWIVPCVHPSFVIRTGFMESPLFEVDLERGARFNTGARPPTEYFVHNPSPREVEQYVDECRLSGEFGLDIETPETGLDDDELDPQLKLPIELIGVSARVGEAMGVRPDQFELLRPLFDRPQNGVKLKCWTHNGGNFDFYHLKNTLGFSLGGITQYDCMLGMHLLWPHLTNKDAATCFSIFCDIPYYKNTRKLNPEFYDTIGNTRDTYGALWAGQRILRQMQAFRRMGDLFQDHMMALTDWVCEVRTKGVNSDVDKSQRTLIALDRTLQAYENWWNKNIPFHSWSSPKQLITLFKSMGIPIYKRKRQKKDEDGNKVVTYSETMDDEALEEYVKKGNKTAGLIRTMRELKHACDLVSIARQDGRIYPRLKLHGQVGGRIQAVDGYVQTIPEEICQIKPRQIIIPDQAGQVLLCADYSQIELRLYAIQAGARNLLDRMASGDYVYGFFYEDIFQRPFFVDDKPRTKRYIRAEVRPWEVLIVKSWPLGFIYGRGVPEPTQEMITSLGLINAQRKAREVYNKFHAENPEIKRFHTKLEFEATRQGYLLSPFGRIRRFPNPKGARNEILAFPGQSVAVDVLIRNAIRTLPKLLQPFGGRLLFTVHDSVVCQFDAQHIVEVDKLVTNAMEAPLAELDNWSIPTERKYGRSWGDLMSLDKYLREMDPQSARAVGDVQTVIDRPTAG
jgi:uracil-DNA glycosylase family 4